MTDKKIPGKLDPSRFNFLKNTNKSQECCEKNNIEKYENTKQSEINNTINEKEINSSIILNKAKPK
jgi:hypothetical protein